MTDAPDPILAALRQELQAANEKIAELRHRLTKSSADETDHNNRAARHWGNALILERALQAARREGISSDPTLIGHRVVNICDVALASLDETCRDNPSRLAAADATLARVQAALRRLEFGIGGGFCPACRWTRENGHDPSGCWLAAALAPQTSTPQNEMK